MVSPPESFDGPAGSGLRAEPSEDASGSASDGLVPVFGVPLVSGGFVFGPVIGSLVGMSGSSSYARCRFSWLMSRRLSGCAGRP